MSRNAANQPTIVDLIASTTKTRLTVRCERD